MGYQGAHVDVSALREVADSFDYAGELVERAATARLSFDGALAGREHAADGDAVRRALDQLVVGVAHWSRAAAEIGAGLRAGALRYADADQNALARIR